MTDEGKLREQYERGERAKSVLNNELIQEAFEKIEKELDHAWKNSSADDEKGRYNAYLMYRLLQNLKQQFTHVVTTGEHAGTELLKLEERKKSAFRK